MSECVIYALHLIDAPEDVRYVGQTVKSARVRLAGHRGQALHRLDRGLPLSHVQRWILKYGTERIGITVLETVDSPDLLNEREAHWIAHFRDAGASLTNIGNGGDAVWRGGKRPEHSERMRGAGNPMFGQDRSVLMADVRAQQDPTESLQRLQSNPARGERNSKARLTVAAVREIRAEHPVKSLSQIARERGVSVQSIWAIVHRKTWAHVD